MVVGSLLSTGYLAGHFDDPFDRSRGEPLPP